MSALHIIDWFLWLKCILFFFSILIGHAALLPIGGVLHALITLPMMVPVVGRLYEFLINGPIKLRLIIKLLSWFVSASGALLGYLFAVFLIGEPKYVAEFFAILIAASIAVLNGTNYVFTFEVVPPADEMFSGLKKIPMLGKYMDDFDEDMLDKIARTNFIDMFLSQFLRLMAECGIIFFALAKLGFVQLVSNATPMTIWECLKVAFSMQNIGSSGDLFVGAEWQVIKSAYQLTLIIWFTMFIQLGPSLMDRSMDRAKNRKNRIDEINEGVANEVEKFLRENGNENHANGEVSTVRHCLVKNKMYLFRLNKRSIFLKFNKKNRRNKMI